MRRYDLDWLRVLVFALLIFYHVGMFFVPWGYHLKNNVIYDWLKWPMLFLNQWRLPILFVISGMGTYYALSKRSALQFAMERIKRLFLPLIVGMLFVVPPQVYFERLSKEQFSGPYLEFWPSEAFIGSYPTGNLSWHHLWFLVYLLVYSLILIPIFIYIRKKPQLTLVNGIRRLAASRHGLFLLVLPLFLFESFLHPLFPSTHALIDDWFTFFHYMTLFFYGFLIISVKDTFWRTVQKNRQTYLIYGFVGFTIITLKNLYLEETYAVHILGSFIKVINLWSWILAIFGYAATYLNRNNRLLAYSNEAVYPFYILHQTVIIACGYYLMNLNWNFWIKSSIMVIATFGVSFVLFEFLIRRIGFLRPLFGLKTRKKCPTSNKSFQGASIHQA